MENTKAKIEVLYNEYNSSIVSATILSQEGEESSQKLRLKTVEDTLQISVFDVLGEEEELLSMNKKEILQFIKLLNDVSRPLKHVVIEPETPTED